MNKTANCMASKLGEAKKRGMNFEQECKTSILNKNMSIMHGLLVKITRKIGNKIR